MLLHFLSFTFRAFRKQRMFFCVTTIGLSLALGASLLILSFVNHELSFEKCHENLSRIYRVGGTWSQRDMTRFLAATLYPLGPSLKEALPEVQEQVRLRRMNNVTIQITSDRTIEEPKFLLADPSVFSVFSIPLIHGDSLSVLSQPNSVVISEQASEVLFVGAEALGKTITICDSIVLTVTGIMADLSHKTQLHTNFLASFATLEKMGEDINTWNKSGSSEAYTFLMLPEAITAETIDQKIPEVLTMHLGEDAHKYDLHLQPLEDLYLGSKLSDELGPTGSMRDVYTFAGISILLVLMACFNYVNLATSRVFHRQREMLVRSTAGASRLQLFIQFLSESVMLTSIAMFLGLVFYEISIPYLEAYVGKSLDLSLSNDIFVWVAAPALIFIVGVLSGSYPAVVLLRLCPKGTQLNHVSIGSAKSKVRRSLVVFQALIAVCLIGFTSGIQKQLNYIENYDHGFETDNTWLIEFEPDATLDQKQRFKLELNRIGIKDATLSTNAPGENLVRITVLNSINNKKSETNYLNTFTGDADYCSTFGLRLVQGHLLSDESAADTPGAVLITETASESLGLKEPIGTVLSSSRGLLRVVGVVKDLFALSLHNKVMPSIITSSSTSVRLLAMRIPENLQDDLLPKIRNIWSEVFPGTGFDCRPLSEVMAVSYKAERKLILLFSLASGLAIVIACLGLLGLVSFIVERRTKEIGIRKSVGASVTSIAWLLTGEFIVLIMIAGLIAWPVTSYIVNRWLENFVYRTEYGLSTYGLVVAGVLLLTLVTVSTLAIKAATANPVDALRNE